MGTLTEICVPKFWALQDALGMLKLLSRITEKHRVVINKHLSEQRYCIKSAASKEKQDSYDKLVTDEMVTWGSKMTRLGVKVINGGNTLLFDNGFGYYVCENDFSGVRYYMGYTDKIEDAKPIKLMVVQGAD